MSSWINEDRSRTEYMPRLASTMTGCIRWRWEDLESALAEQVSMLADGETDAGGLAGDENADAAASLTLSC